jgi:hypothetical protein
MPARVAANHVCPCRSPRHAGEGAGSNEDLDRLGKATTAQ